jgi:hypothetical protein
MFAYTTDHAEAHEMYTALFDEIVGGWLRLLGRFSAA